MGTSPQFGLSQPNTRLGFLGGERPTHSPPPTGPGLSLCRYFSANAPVSVRQNGSVNPRTVAQWRCFVIKSPPVSVCLGRQPWRSLFPLLSKMEAERGSAATTSPVRPPAILLRCSCNVLQEHLIHFKNKHLHLLHTHTDTWLHYKNKASGPRRHNPFTLQGLGLAVLLLQGGTTSLNVEPQPSTHGIKG